MLMINDHNYYPLPSADDFEDEITVAKSDGQSKEMREESQKERIDALLRAAGHDAPPRL